MVPFAVIRPLSETKRIRVGLSPLPSNLLRLIQRVAHEKPIAEPRTHHTTIVTISAMSTHK